MTSKITIFDHYCHPLVEFSNIPTTPRSWILNDYGRCEFSIGYDPTLPQSVQLCQERYFQYGNLIHIEHIPTQDENNVTNGQLPDWTGIILQPRNWQYGILPVVCYGIEALLDFRAMPYVKTTGSPATIFRDIINKAQVRAKNIPIQYGNIDDIQKTFSDELRQSAYKHIKKLVKDAQMDWGITGSINAKGNLDLYANLYVQKGIDTPLILNNQNTESTGDLLKEQGTPANHVFGYSDAFTQRSRYSVESKDENSINDYGPLELNAVFVGRKDKISTQNATDTKIDNRSRPIKLTQRNALDYKNTFSYLNIGNTFTIKDSNVGFAKDGTYGFESIFRIIGMSYNDLSNKVPLNIEFVKDI